MADIFGYLREEPRREIVAELAPAVLGPLLDLVEPDVAVDILHGLPDQGAQATLAAMRTAGEVAPLLGHPDNTAGGRMTTDFVALNKEWSVEEALTYLRRTKPAAEQVFYLYVVDGEHRLEGVVSLRQLVVAAPDERIGGLMTPDVMSVTASQDQEEVAREIQHYNFIALPVVDDARHLVGVVSVDDLMDVAEEEATEDMYRMVGLAEDESLLRPITRSVAPRLSWLLLNLLTAFAAAGMVATFEDTIQRAAVVAVFMPVIAGMGGNAGIQTITLMVRSIALRDVELGDVRYVLRRELAIGIINGVTVGLLVGVLAYAWKGNVALGVVAGLAMLLNMATAVTVGVLVPVTLKALRLDPALASGVLVTTFTDVLGFFFFLGLATLMVERIA
jgi:magnesium transporter